ncbi:IS5 family transposase [Streptomyces sp. PSKA30]|uniref:IS5 family transposase n=1 Tax=Streptomyces sp. PSKA30 TaxID=2874597 RepID=UPI0021E465E7|nr:IS5 family transposase [Streptomyces sp. PSKA30]
MPSIPVTPLFRSSSTRGRSHAGVEGREPPCEATKKVTGGASPGAEEAGRGKPGSKMHILSDANGLPLVVGVSAANTHDSKALKPMVEGHQTRHDPHRGRHFKPERLHADKAYDVPHLRKWLRGKRIGVRIARKGIESSERLGRRRRVIERTMSWRSGYRRLSPRYERNPRNYLAFLGLAAALCCYKRLVRLTT